MLSLFNKSTLFPHSSTFPSPNTNILSTHFKVDSRCAIVSTVLFLNLFLIKFWMCSSLFTSILAVASSIKTILLFFKNALLIQRSCFSPAERLSFERIACSPPFYSTKFQRLHSSKCYFNYCSE